MILLDSPFWTVHLFSTQRAWVHDLTILSDPIGANGDGVDPDSARDIVIERVAYVGSDDAVSVKSGWDNAGIEFGQPSVNITIRDCVFTTRDACIAIGSEMSGGVENVTAVNISCIGTGRGASIKTSMGRGGYIRSFAFTDSLFQGVTSGIDFFLTYGDHPDAPGAWNKSARPILTNFVFARIQGVGVQSAGNLTGVPNIPIDGVLLQDVDLGADAQPWVCTNVTGQTAGTVVPSPCPELQM